MMDDPVARWMLGEDVRCGTCVIFNDYNGAAPGQGYCAIRGTRHRDEQPCRRWFPMTELHKPLYGGTIAWRREVAERPVAN